MTVKRDFRITEIGQGSNIFHLEMRKSFLFVFRWWELLTYSEAENSEEIPLEFKCLEDAVDFIEYIIKNSLVD